MTPLIHKNIHRMPLAWERDKTIARNLDALVGALSLLQPEHDGYRWNLNPTYLVILGAAHLPSTAKLLVEQYGFTESALP